MEWHFWLVACIGVWLTGVSKSGFAGGVGTVAVPMMAPFVGGEIAIGLMLPILILMDGLTVWGYRRQLSWPLIRPLIPGVLAGIAVGTVLLGSSNEHSIQLLIGCMGFWVLIQRFVPAVQRFITTRTAGVLAPAHGMLAGVGSTLAHAGAAPLQAYYLLQKLDHSRFLAQVSATVGMMNLAKCVPYGMLGVLDITLSWSAAILIPVAWLGVVSGRWLAGRMSGELFFRIMMALLALNSCWLVWQGLSGS